MQVRERGGSHHASAQQLTKVIGSCSSWQELQHAVQAHRPQLNHVHVTAAATRLAHVAAPPLDHLEDSAAFGRFTESVYQLIALESERLDQRGLANILWALAKLGSRPCGDAAPSTQL